MIPDVGIPADLLRRRPDVRIAEANVAAATATIGIAEADLYPRLSLLGTISVSSTDTSSLFQSDSLAFSVGPSFNWNILHFGRIHDNIDIQESRFRQTVADYRSSILAAVNEIEDSLAKYDGYQTQLTALEKARQADANAVELSLERYKVGKANFQRVLDAQLQLLQDSQATAIARANATIQLVRLYRATGGGWDARSGCKTQDCTCESCGGSTDNTILDYNEVDSPAPYQPTPTAQPKAPFSILSVTTTQAPNPRDASGIALSKAKRIARASKSAATDLYDWGIVKNQTVQPPKFTPSPDRKVASAKPTSRDQSNVRKLTTASKRTSGAERAMYFTETQPKQKRRSSIRKTSAEIESMVWKSSAAHQQPSPTTPSK